ncbi:MAG: hypothetical protein ACXVEE_01400 [Polyangiales bacterium]
MEGFRRSAFVVLVVVAVIGALVFALRGGPTSPTAPTAPSSTASVASATPEAGAPAVPSMLPVPAPQSTLPIDPKRILEKPPTDKPTCPGLEFVDQWEGKSHTRGCIVIKSDGGVTREGRWIVQEEEGWTSTGNFKNDMKEGRWIRWYPNGNVAWVEDWTANQRNGSQIQWDESGARVLDRTWKDGFLDGVEEVTNPDGSVTRHTWKLGIEQK